MKGEAQARRAAAKLTARAPRSVGRPRTVETGQASLALILTLVRSGRATTRLELEREAELTRAVVADRLAALQALRLIEEGELGRPTRGRAPRHMRFCSRAGALLVATLERSSISVAVADLMGKVLVEHHEAADLAAGPAVILDRLTTLFFWLMEEHGGKQAIWGVGLAMPGPVEALHGEPDAVLAPEARRDWRSFDVISETALRLGAPVFVRSGTQMMTIGELKAGAGTPDMLFVKLGRTISAGIASAGRLHRGAQGAAGMIGHVPTREESDVPCHCGSNRCLEAVAGGDAIARQGLAAARSGRSRYLADILTRSGEVTAAEVSHGAQFGDAFCAEIMARCGRLVGESLAPLVNLLNPSTIMLGGSMAQSGDALLAAVREAIYRQSHPLVTRDLTIVQSRMGNSSGLVGAAQVVADELFASNMLQSWITLGTPRRLPSLVALINEARSRSLSARQVGPPS